MKKDRQKLDTSKRDFIKKSALAGAGVIAATAVSGEAMATVSEDTEQPSQSKGYRLTAHVLDYYKSAAS